MWFIFKRFMLWKQNSEGAMAALWKHLCDSGNISWKEKKFELRLKEEKLLALQESTEKA